MKLTALLPYLALAAYAAEPASAAHGSRAHRERHGQLARNVVGKPAVARSVAGAQPRPRVIRRSDGTQCRVRPESQTASADGGAPASTDSAPASTDDSAPTSTDGSAPASTSTEQPSAEGSADSSADPTSAEPSASAQPSDLGTPGAANNLNAQATQTSASTDVAQPTGGSSAPPPGGYPHPKFGLAWPMENYVGAGTFYQDRASWYYSWQGDDLATVLNAEFVPLYRPNGRNDPGKPDEGWKWSQDQLDWPTRPRAALFINEPNVAPLVDVDSAIGHWRDEFVPGTNGMTRVSAATTDDQSGIDWQQAFFTKTSQQGLPQPDAVAVHWYGGGIADTTADGFIADITNWHNLFPNLKLWITEYAPQNFDDSTKWTQQVWNEGDLYSFHEQVTSWMDGTDWIERYAPFGWTPRENNSPAFNQNLLLMSTDGCTEPSGGADGCSGTPTGLGYWYLNRNKPN